jgi:hypothetical protein
VSGVSASGARRGTPLWHKQAQPGALGPRVAAARAQYRINARFGCDEAAGPAERLAAITGAGTPGFSGR